jgi:putative transposase
VNANQAIYTVATMCRVLAVSASGYYARRKRPPSARARADAELTARISAIHQYSRATYGAPRIHEELLAAGMHVGRKRVARLMKAAGLWGVSRRQWVTTTVRERGARPAPDLVERNFTAAAPDRLWVADITYIPTWAGFLYLAVVLDTFSRRIVGWAMATHLRTELVLEALNLALWQRRPAAVIHHSDQGSQYTSLAFGQRCREAGVRPSMGSVGDCFDNAMCESFFATLECELLDRRRFKTQLEARMAVFEFIEGWYNPHRRHSARDYLSPINYERIQPNRKSNRKPNTVHRNGVAPLERQIGRLLERNARAAGRYLIDLVEDPSQPAGVRLKWSARADWDDWARHSEGCYLLRTNITDWDAEQLWRTYIQLSEAEAAFRIHKSELAIRPIWHQRADRVQAHILVCFLAYVLWKTLEQWQSRAGLGNSPRTILEELGRIQSADVVLPLAEEPSHKLRIRCVVRPDQAQALLLDRLGLRLPERLRPPPLISEM